MASILCVLVALSVSSAAAPRGEIGRTVTFVDSSGASRTAQLTKKVREGSWSATYRAADTASGEALAIKLRKANRIGQNPGAYQREAAVAARVKHPALMKVYAIGKLDGTGQEALVMELVPGKTVYELYAGKPIRPSPQAFAIAARVLEGIDAFHQQGLIHKSLHAENVMVDSRQSVASGVKVVDFGGAVEIGSQWQANKDVAEVAGLLVLMLTGREVVQHQKIVYPELEQALLQLPDYVVSQAGNRLSLHELIRKATHPDANQRYQSASEFRALVERFANRNHWQLQSASSGKAP